MSRPQPSMAELCRQLDAHRIPALALELADARDRVALADRTAEALAERVGAWETLNVFSDAASEVRRDQAREEAKSARDAASAAVETWEAALKPCQTSPVVDVVVRIELLIDEALRDRDIGRAAPASRRFRSRVLEVTQLMAEHWLGDLDLAALAERLADHGARARAAALAWEAPPPQGDWHLTFVDTQALESRAAILLMNPRGGFAALGGALDGGRRRDRERLESSAAAYEKEITVLDRLRPGMQAREQDAAWAAKRRNDDWLVHGDPLEKATGAIVEAMCHHPIVWVQISLLAATEMVDAVEPDESPRLLSDGRVEPVTTLGHRALLLAQLVEVRRATERAFPGIPHRVYPRGLAKRVTPRRVDPSPSYRRAPHAAQTTAHEAELPLVLRPREEVDDTFFARLQRGPVRGIWARAVVQAQLRALNRLRIERHDVPVADRLAFWSTTDVEARAATLNARFEDHAGKLRILARHADEVVATAAVQDHPWAGLSHALANAHTSVRTLDTFGGTSSSPMACPVVRREAIRHWLEVLRALLRKFFAVKGERRSWAQDVCSRISSASGVIAPPAVVRSYSDVVEMLAAHLQPLGFWPLMWHLSQSAPELQRATEEEERYATQVSWFDKVNVFTSTENEQLREQWRAYREHLGDEVEELRGAAITMMTNALAQYPPLALLERVTAATYEVDGVEGVLKHRSHTRKGPAGFESIKTTYYCGLRGLPAAIDAVRRVVETAMDILGPLPSPDEVMEAWLRHQL